jgi:hypothetical protein
MPTELGLVTGRLAGSVPYFFYDILGRVFPGLFLLGGLVLTFKGSQFLQQSFGQVRLLELLLGGTAFAALCFLAGFTLDAVGRWIFHFMRPRYVLSALRHQYGSPADQESQLETAFKTYFGFSLGYTSEDPEYLATCGRLCRLVVAASDSALDSQLARVDAEECLSRALAVASATLMILNPFLRHWISSIVYVACVRGFCFGFLVLQKEAIARETAGIFCPTCQ